MNKIVSKDKFKNSIRQEIKSEGKSIALCHGVFDLVHPGHIIHLQQAKTMADVLVVSITAARYVRKGPGRPYFDDDTRLQVLSALECVDYVMLSDGYTVDDIVEAVEPDIYVKGQEYAQAENDLTGKITAEKELVEKHGGRIEFTTGQVFSSTRLINTALGGLSDEVSEYMKDFNTRHTLEEFVGLVDKISQLKVLVIGEAIIDKYTYCTIQGLMTKDVGYSATLERTEEYFGGAIAVARHIATFTDTVSLMTIMGKEDEYTARVESELHSDIDLKITHSEIYPTIVKHRYISKNVKREEYRKIFSINNIPPQKQYEDTIYRDFKNVIEEKIADYDVVFVCDFGHGLIDEEIREIIQGKAKKIVLCCQTNSANKGFNIITKYRRADFFCVEQQELKLALMQESLDERKGLKKLGAHLNGTGWLTRGSLGALGIDDSCVYECPAFALVVKDTVGAVEAFTSIAGLFAAVDAPCEVGTFAGNIAGALATNIVGNKETIEKVNVLKFASTLMNV